MIGMVALAAKIAGPVVLAAGLAGGALVVSSDQPATAPVGDCGEAYNRSKHFGSVPTPSARRAAIKAATNEQGEIIDYYTGLPVDPKRIDVDHVVSLKDTWPVSCAWTRQERRSMANAQIMLVPTDLSINRSKGELGPAEWSPANRDRACAYGARYVDITALYDLPLTGDEAKAILMACGVTAE
jgi:hypothetical protein